MGLIISRFRKNKTIKERLQSISKDITNIELFKLHTQQKQRAYVGRFVLGSVLLIILAASALYFWALPERTFDRILYLVPFLFFPFVIVFLKRLITWYFARQINSNETKLIKLREEKKKLLDEVMDKETYKTAKEILEQFAPEQLRKDTNMSNAIVPRASPQGAVVGRPALPQQALQSPQLINQELRRRTMTPGVNQPTPQRIMPPGQPTFPALQQRPGMMPAGPPMARPVLPRDRGVMDKLVEFIVGDGPTNRFALICKQCASHNGMALQEEFEYLAFRCCYCFAWNPARKQRPPAPLLPLPSAPTQDKEGESSPSSESENDEGIKEGEPDEDQQFPPIDAPEDSENALGEEANEDKSAKESEGELQTEKVEKDAEVAGKAETKTESTEEQH